MKYDDIINLPRPVSRKHPRMPMTDRAAQFAPFMALVGYGDEVKESQRLTDKRIEQSESEKELINEKLLLLCENISERPYAKIVYFVPDEKKEGGAYVTAEGRIRRIDAYAGLVMMTDGRAIPMGDILEI